MEYWKQHEIKLIADVNADNLIIGMEESGSPRLFKVEQRSKGFQWFLSFYLRLKARKENINMILIDEPGLYFHAKAQKDVLRVLENISKEAKIVFSTHSPYLLDIDRLDRVRLVLKSDKKGSIIENIIHKNADVETLTPIITAIGLDISHDLKIEGKGRNVLLEGISDYYFLHGVKDILGL
jgi:predicted ATP-dependent endonuclease of OLD family